MKSEQTATCSAGLGTRYRDNVVRRTLRAGSAFEFDEMDLKLNHCALGLATEAGEIQDAIKKRFYYGAPLDEANLLEEAGDLMFYVVGLLDCIGATLEEAMAANERKLRARYPGGFNEEDALQRDTAAERQALQG